MSVNCIRCVKNRRTGIDLLCDDCRANRRPVFDSPAAWAIQREAGGKLKHHPRCSSVPGWSPISGRGLLCDCGAVEAEWKRRLAQAVHVNTRGCEPMTPEAGAALAEAVEKLRDWLEGRPAAPEAP